MFFKSPSLGPSDFHSLQPDHSSAAGHSQAPENYYPGSSILIIAMPILSYDAKMYLSKTLQHVIGHTS